MISVIELVTNSLPINKGFKIPDGCQSSPMISPHNFVFLSTTFKYQHTHKKAKVNSFLLLCEYLWQIIFGKTWTLEWFLKC